MRRPRVRIPPPALLTTSAVSPYRVCVVNPRPTCAQAELESEAPLPSPSAHCGVLAGSSVDDSVVRWWIWFESRLRLHKQPSAISRQPSAVSRQHSTVGGSCDPSHSTFPDRSCQEPREVQHITTCDEPEQGCENFVCGHNHPPLVPTYRVPVTRKDRTVGNPVRSLLRQWKRPVSRPCRRRCS